MPENECTVRVAVTKNMIIIMHGIFLILLSPCFTYGQTSISTQDGSGGDTYTYSLLTPKVVLSGEPLIAHLTVYESRSCSDCALSIKAILRRPATDVSKLDKFLLETGKIVAAGPALVSLESSLQPGYATALVLQTSSTWSAAEAEHELLITDASGALNISTVVHIFPSSPTLYIETDKPIYKPSQTVHFRIFAVDRFLKPVNISLNITVSDPLNNKLRRWTNETTRGGVIQLELPLSDQPPLGDWKIAADSRAFSQIYAEVSVAVAEYTLPEFDLRMNSPNYVQREQHEHVTVGVECKFTYGEPCSGALNVTVTCGRESVTESFEKFVGSTNLSFGSSDLDLLVRECRDGYLLIDAEFVEKDSKRSGFAQTTVSVLDSVYTIEYLETSMETFQPGCNFTAYFQLSTEDAPHGSTLDSGLLLNISTSFRLGNGLVEFIHHLLPVPETGLVVLHLLVPVAAETLLMVSTLIQDGVVLRGLQVRVDAFEVSNRSNSLQLEKADFSVVKTGDTVNFVVTSSQPRLTYFYIVTSQGAVVGSGNGSLPLTRSFTVATSVLHTPSMTVLLYALVGDELLADSVTVNVKGLVSNHVSLEFQQDFYADLTTVRGVTNQSLPGQPIILNVNTTAGSYVGLTSVDSGILLLGNPNQITQSKVFEELLTPKKYADQMGCMSGYGVRYSQSLPVDFDYPMSGGVSTIEIISKAGFYLDTNLNMVQCAKVAYAIGNTNKDDTDYLHTRTDFPDTWIWQLVQADSSRVAVALTVPDSITTWVTYAVSLHPQLGLAVTDIKHQLKVFQPLFISLNLPYAAVYGEEFELRVVVRNFNRQDDDCTVSLLGNASQFESKFGEFGDYSNVTLEKVVNIIQNQGQVVLIWIRPRKFGSLTLNVKAICNSGQADAVRQTLFVKPNGKPASSCWNNFITLAKGDQAYTGTVNLTYPSDVVAESKRVEATISGDILGPAISGLDRLVQLPFGCGEQNMVVFAPSIFVRQYLSQLDALNEHLLQKTTDVMLKGYQRQLTYRHPDGSFSAFGDRDQSGSTWLTAFVLKCFRSAVPFLNDSIDQKVLASAQKFLFLNRQPDGPFSEPGYVIHTEMQGGGTASRFSLTAYIVIALLEDETNRSAALISLNSTVSYLEMTFASSFSDPYKLAIIAYALSLAKSPKAVTFLRRLVDMAAYDTDATCMYWRIAENDVGNGAKVGASGVELASYALLAHLETDNLIPAHKIAQWLIRQQNVQGGFASTQDTVLALQALALYARHVVPDDMRLTAAFTPDKGDSFTISITKADFFLTTKHTFDNLHDLQSVTLVMSGYGSSLLRVCSSYYVVSESSSPSINLIVDTSQGSSSAITLVKACAKTAGQQESGMGVISIAMPSGHMPIIERLSSSCPSTLKRTELAADHSVNCYFDKFSENDTCVILPIVKVNEVVNTQAAHVTAYDYYKPEVSISKLYVVSHGSVSIMDPVVSTRSAAVTRFSSSSLFIAVLTFCYLFHAL